MDHFMDKTLIFYTNTKSTYTIFDYILRYLFKKICLFRFCQEYLMIRILSFVTSSVHFSGRIILLWGGWQFGQRCGKTHKDSSAGAVKANVHLTARTHEKHQTNIHIFTTIIQKILQILFII